MKDAKTRIRPAVAADAAAIAAVHVRSWQAAYRGLLPDELLDNLSVEQRTRWWGVGWWNQDMGRRRMLVAEADDAIVAFADIGPSRDDDAPETTGELNTIYADPDAWGQGIGRLLMERAVDELRSAGFSAATLWVLETNQRARRFYEIAGWDVDGASRTEELGDDSVAALEVRYRREL